MSFTAQQLLAAVEALAAEEKANEEAASAKAKAAAEADAAAAAAAKKAEEDAKAKATDDKQEPEQKPEQEQDDEAKKQIAELQEKFRAEAQKAVESKLQAEFVGRGFSADEAAEILPFINCGTIMSDEGEVDEEKLTTLVDRVSSLSLRKPPRGETKDFSSGAGGIGKYLNK